MSDYKVPGALIGGLLAAYYGHDVAGADDPDDNDRQKTNRALAYGLLGAGAGYGAGAVLPNLGSNFKGDQRKAIMGALGGVGGALVADHYAEEDDKMRVAKILGGGLVGGGLGYGLTGIYGDQARHDIKADVTANVEKTHSHLLSNPKAFNIGAGTGAAITALGLALKFGAKMAAGPTWGASLLAIPAIGWGIGELAEWGAVEAGYGRDNQDFQAELTNQLKPAIQRSGWEYSTDTWNKTK